jgi:TonB family protein
LAILCVQHICTTHAYHVKVEDRRPIIRIDVHDTLDDFDDEPRTLIEWIGRLLLADTPGTPERLAGRAIVLIGLIAWTWMLARASIESNAVGASFLHSINLPFHEAGHILFMFFGHFQMTLGGSLTQLLVPGALTIVFLTRHRDPFGAAVTFWWFGENLLDLAPYINDARALQLVLIGGKTGAEVEGHDWERILMTLGWLHRDHAIARIAHFFGGVIMMLACAWAAALVIRQWQSARSDPGSRGGYGGKVYEVGADVRSPVLLYEVKPQYTPDAMRIRIQGEVLLSAVVGPDGTVSRLRVVRSLDPTSGLDEQALDAVRRWRFKPGTRFGQPVAVQVQISVGFTMR